MRTGRAGEARFALHARLTPLAAVALDQLSLDAHDLDLDAWDAALPATRLDVKAEGRPADGGLAGRFEAENAIAGPIDANRLPLRSISRALRVARATRSRSTISSPIESRRRAVTGNARVPLEAAPASGRSTFTTSTSRQFHSTLATTRLSGSLGADLDAARQSDRRSRRRSRHRRRHRSVVCRHARRAQARGRTLPDSRRRRRARGQRLRSSSPDAVRSRSSAKAKRVDPSRFGKFPAGKLDGDVAATGALDPSWQAAAKVAIANGSQLAGVPLSGKLRGTFAPRVVRDAAIDFSLASARLVASGNIGPDAEGLAIAFDAPQARGARAAAARTRSETACRARSISTPRRAGTWSKAHWSSGRTAMR